MQDILTFTFLPWLKQERAPHSVATATGRVRKMIRPQTSSFLCKPWRWYADLAVGWHLKVVNCANLCFRLERSWIVRVFHHELTPHSPLAQLQIREGVGRGCWFLRWPPYSCPPLFKVVHEYLYAQTVWKMKINLQLNGRRLGYLFSLRKKGLLSPFRMSGRHFIFFIFLNVCISNYSCFFLIGHNFLLLHPVPTQRKISVPKCLL